MIIVCGLYNGATAVVTMLNRTHFQADRKIKLVRRGFRRNLAGKCIKLQKGISAFHCVLVSL